MDTRDGTHSFFLDRILDAAPGLELHELQIAYRAIEAALQAQFNARRSACDHVGTARAYIELPRPPNRSFGCAYCLTVLAEGPDGSALVG